MSKRMTIVWHSQEKNEVGWSSDGEGADPVAVDFRGDGALQKRDGGDEAEAAFHFDYDAFGASERAALNEDAAADFEEGPGLDGEAGITDVLEGGDFGIVDGDGGAAGADDVDDSGGGEDTEGRGGVEAAEDVAGEEREVEFLDAIGPAAAAAEEGKELREALFAQEVGGGEFEAGADADGVPGLGGGEAGGEGGGGGYEGLGHKIQCLRIAPPFESRLLLFGFGEVLFITNSRAFQPGEPPNTIACRRAGKGWADIAQRRCEFHL